MPACSGHLLPCGHTCGSGSLSVTAMLDFSGKANTSIHGLGEDNTANFGDNLDYDLDAGPGLPSLISRKFAVSDY